ncbi:MAG: PilW family protein [Sutterellaceae bacterium]|nr:PilW family protein [Burkholderiaceae bacterium]MDW8429728.1 PilW family protein [Sutterellaceae bacterium]
MLIALAIGLLLSIGILSTYLANRNVYRANTDLQRIQAAGQLALDRLAYQIRMAGYGKLLSDFANVAVPSAFIGEALRVCAGGFANPNDPSDTPACAAAATGADALQVRYQVEDAPVAGSGNWRDCLGFEVPPDTNGLRIARNRFFVADSNGVPTLMCSGNTAGPQPLIPNVEDLRIRLRIGDPFTRAERVVEPVGFQDWGRVLAVELCVQVRSEEAGLTAGPQDGQTCRGTAFPNDGRLRRTFTQVVTLRNRTL